MAENTDRGDDRRGHGRRRRSADLFDRRRRRRGAVHDRRQTPGALTFVAAPDFEAPTDAGGDNVYDVTVSATDGTFTDSQAIAVTVTNVNEQPPVITSNGGGATRAIKVAENSTAVTTVTATRRRPAPALTYLDRRRRRRGAVHDRRSPAR